MEKLIIIGAGGFGREVAWLVERINKENPTWELLGFLDDGIEKGTSVGKYCVLGGCDTIAHYSDVQVVCAVGNSKTRKKIIEHIEQISPKQKFATLLDPTVQISDSAIVGEGSIICANSLIMVDLKIGKHAIINLGSTVGHDDLLGDYVTINPNVNVCGNVTVGDSVELGVGSKIIQGKTIGDGAVIGAGAIVTRDIARVADEDPQ